MKADRAWTVLSAVRARSDVSANQQEQEELVVEGLLRTISAQDRQAMEAEVKELEPLTAKVRAACREGDSPMGTKAMMARPSPAKSEGYCHDLRRLESMLMRKASLECMVYSSSTGCNLSVTSEGERVLEDLEAWRARYGGMELKELLTRLGAMRAEMNQTISQAAAIAGELRGFTNSRFLTPVRAPALVLAERKSSSARAVNVASAKGFDGRLDGDRLMMASLVSANEGTGEELAQSYERTKAKAVAAGMEGPEQGFQALSLMGGDEAKTDLAMDRMQTLKASLPLSNDDLAWLALSEHSADRAIARYNGLMGSFTSKGMVEDDQLRRAAAIMAGSDMKEASLIDRFSVLHDHLQWTFASPTAAAMLAVLPLEPEESLAVLRDSIGAVSRANFFDDAEEVNNLALLLTAGMGPKLVSEAGPARPSEGSSFRGEEVGASRTGPLNAFLPFWVHRSYNEPTLRRIASHPAHMHTVPYFG